MRRREGPEGAELRTRRKAAGLSQHQLAQAAGIGRHTVSYWENKPRIDPRGWAVRHMAKALGWELPDNWTSTRARGDGVLSPFAAMDAWVEAQLSAARLREAARAAQRRVICGAKTRKGASCRNKSEPGKRRCKFHGGKSTGARTPEGLERIREAQRRRWAKAKDSNCPALPLQDPDPAVTREIERARRCQHLTRRASP